MRELDYRVGQDSDWIISLRNVDDESLCDQFVVRNVDEDGAQAAGLAATKRWKYKSLYWTVVQVVDYEGEI